MKEINGLGITAMILVIIGALNWLLIGLFNWNLVTWISFGFMWITTTVYIVIGIAGLYMVYYLTQLKS